MADVSPLELKAAFVGPAVFVDRFLVNIYPSHVRVAFSETDGISDSPNLRSVVAISHQDAIALKDLLIELLFPIEKHIQESQEKAKANAS